MTVQEKHCPGCCAKGETLPADEFDLDPTKPDGLAELCKECVSFNSSPASKAKNKPQITEKKCNTCGLVKPIGEFHRKAYNKDGYNFQCKACKAQYVAERNKKLRGVTVAPPASKKKQAEKPAGLESAACVKEESQTQYTTTRGPKDSAGKTQWSVFPFLEAEFVVRVFQNGSKKYGGPFTYRRGIPVEKLAEAAIRHLIAIMSGERIDPESGELHAAHVAANGLMMISQSIADGVK